MLNFKIFFEAASLAASRTLLKEAGSEVAPIPVEAGKKLWAAVKKITGIPFPNKRFTGDYSYVRAEVKEGKHRGAELAISGGILVVQCFEGIPNVGELVAFLKKHFGDVHEKGGEYVNCREWGREFYVPTGSIEVKGVLAPLPDPDEFTGGGRTVKQVAGAIDEVVRSRECRVVGKPHAQCKVVGKLGLTEQLVSWEKFLFVVSFGHFYQVESASEGQALVRLMNIRHAALRQAEVSAWKYGDMSNPNG